MNYREYEEVTELQERGADLNKLKETRNQLYDEYITACEKFEERCIPSSTLVSAYTAFDDADKAYLEAAGELWYEPVVK